MAAVSWPAASTRTTCCPTARSRTPASRGRSPPTTTPIPCCARSGRRWRGPSARRARWSARRLTRAEALRAATWAGAYCCFAEAERGSLEPGKLADLIVLGGDPLTVPADALADLPVELTLVGGRVAHSAGDDLPPVDPAAQAALA